jgi:hypothetical protein
MTDLAEIISALVLLEQQQNQPWVQRLKGAAGDAAPRLARRPEMQPATSALAYPPAQADKVVGRSHTRVKKAIREKELTARKDGSATLIEHAELQRWLASLPVIGRQPAPEQPVPELMDKTKQAAAKDGAAVQRNYKSHVRPPPPPRARSIAKLNTLENNRR